MINKEAMTILRKSNIRLKIYMESTLPKAIYKAEKYNISDLILKGYETVEKCKEEYEAVELAISTLDEKSVKQTILSNSYRLEIKDLNKTIENMAEYILINRSNLTFVDCKKCSIDEYTNKCPKCIINHFKVGEKQ